MSTFIQHMHHGRLVWVDIELMGKHREACLCYSCLKFCPDDLDHCQIAKAVFALDVKENLVTPVWECPSFKESLTRVFHECNTGDEMINTPENFSDEQIQETSPVLHERAREPIESPDEITAQVLMTFNQAMEVLLRGGSVQRLSWPDPMVVVQFVDEKLHIYEIGDNLFHPLILTIGDVTGLDWKEV